MNERISIEELKSLLRYDQNTGKFYYLVKRGIKVVNDEAGIISSNGYLRIEISGRKYLSHRLAWFYVTHKWPEGMIDHINGIKHDNRIENLRISNKHTNQYNSKKHKDNSTGYKNIRLHRDGKYEARISVLGKRIQIGRFNTIEEAVKKYNQVSKEYHGEFLYKEYA